MQKKIPMRMCVGCRAMKPKKELVRIACNKEGEITVDPTGKAPGRGAYVCRSRACLERAVKTRALERAFSVKVGDEVLKSLSDRIDSLPPDESAGAENGGGA